MNALLSFLSGKKTYLTVAVTLGLLLGQWRGWWAMPNEVYAALVAIALAFLRSGVASSSPPAGGGGSSTVPLLIAALFLFSGCASIQPGADPLVVNVERTETIAQASFDLVVQVDNNDRGFWRTNAPAFHAFAEWLRAPQTIGSDTAPRGLGMILSLDIIKSDYENSRASSNTLASALAVLEGTIDQAGAWLTITTNKP